MMHLSVLKNGPWLSSTSLTKAAMWLCCLIFLISAPSHAQLKVGASAPEFEVSGALKGETIRVRLSDMLRQGPVVLYFYPKAFTSGCTIEAQLFAENMDAFQSNGATVMGMSGDDIETLKKFSAGPCGGKFAVAADQDQSVMKSYQAVHRLFGSFANRVSYVITPDRKIVFVHEGSDPEQHVSRTLAAVKAWRSKQ
jgi:peroxiredoxin